ncbi:GNAT family N-acetyltransferase [Candidatus Poribacteria bacterium]|nr:GNAT family N-acetyltransferase [Candidatus Poribacteria bacterium]
MTKLEIKIRKYRSSDFDACRSLWIELTCRHREIYGDPTIGGSDPGHFIEPSLSNENLHGPWVAEVSGNVVGLAGLIIQGEEAEVEPVVVSSQYHSQGIGKTLLDYVVDEARKLGVRFLSVRPVARNVEALTFFVEAGFDLVGYIDLFRDLSVNSQREWKSGITLHGKKLRY